MKKKQFIVIGLGTFGFNVAKNLSEKNVEVLAIDKNEARVNEIAPFVTKAVTADATNEKVLKTLGVSDFDIGIIAIGESLESSILATLLLKELGTKTIIVKSINALHSKIAIKVGADRVVYPELESAKKLVESLISPNILEEIELSPEYNIAEIIAPKKFVNKTLGDLNIRANYKLNVIALKHKIVYLTDTDETDIKTETNISPDANTEIMEGDILVVIGKYEDIKKLQEVV
jgi:trk system potassium uptake protein TrkA